MEEIDQYMDTWNVAIEGTPETFAAMALRSTERRRAGKL